MAPAQRIPAKGRTVFTWWMMAATALTAYYAVWHLAGGRAPAGQGGPSGGESTVHLLDLSFLDILCLLTACVLLSASRRPEFTKNHRSALGLIALGSFIQTAGGVEILIERQILHLPRAPLGVPDILFSISFAATIAGLLILGLPTHRKRSPMRTVVDAATFLVGVGVPFWLSWVQRSLSGVPTPVPVMLTVSPFLTLVGLLALSWAIETPAIQPTRGAIGFVVGGTGVFLLGHLVYWIDRGFSLIPGGTVDIINAFNAIASWLLLVGARRCQIDPFSRAPQRPLLEFSPLPLITILLEVGFLLVLFALGHPDPGLFSSLLGGLGLFMLILLVRETFVVRDGMKRMAGEAEAEGRARFEAMVRRSSDVIMTVDAEFRIRFASPAALTVFGIAPEALVGRDLPSLAHVEDRAQLSTLLDDLILNPGSAGTLNWRAISIDGSTRHLETAGSNQLLEPAIAGLVLNSREVTERIALQQRLQQAGKMEAVGRLAGGIAHDFNNLLTIILANSELALEPLESGHPARQDLEDIRRAASRGATLTRRLLAFSRSENLAPKIVNPVEILQDAVPMIERLMKGTVNLVTRVEPGCGPIRANPDDLVQALINLSTNARDAMPDGGTLSISARSVTLEEPLKGAHLQVGPGRHVVIEVTDTGTGMDEATRERAFEPFFTTKERSRGTGLGLASVYAMVKGSGGGLTLRSARGKGTTLQLWLPEVPAERLDSPGEPAVAAPYGYETILLVEDERALRRAAQRILTSLGYHVLAAGDATEALLLASRHHGTIHLLLSDILIPGRSGAELAGELMSLQPALKVILMSGGMEEQAAGGASGLAGVRLLAKPFARAQLVTIVRQVLAEEPERAAAVGTSAT